MLSSSVSPRTELGSRFKLSRTWSLPYRHSPVSTRQKTSHICLNAFPFIAIGAIPSPETVVDSVIPPETVVETMIATTSPQSSTTNLFAIAAVGLVIALSFVASTFIGGSKVVMSLSPSKLKPYLNQKSTIFVDIRSRAEIKEAGSPSMKGFRCTRQSYPFLKRSKEEGIDESVPKFGENFSKQKAVQEDSVIILLDKEGRNGTAAAREILAFQDFKGIYYVSGGAAALQKAGYDWKTSSRLNLSFKLPKVNFKGVDFDQLAESYKKRPSLINTFLALGAIATGSAVLFNEFDIVLEAVGVVGAVNIFLQSFFFAEDREKTVKSLRSLFDDKIAPGEAGDDLKRLASAILETPELNDVPSSAMDIESIPVKEKSV